MCRQTSLCIDIREHHMEKEEWHCQVTDAWQEDKLARRLAGSRSACFSGYAPGLELGGEPVHSTRNDTQALLYISIGRTVSTETLNVENLTPFPAARVRTCQVTFLGATFTST